MESKTMPDPSARPFGPPPTQENLARATALGFDALARQAGGQFRWLGAEPAGNGWRLPVLEEVLEVDLAARRISTSSGEPVGPPWRILVLHYLAIQAQPEELEPGVTFADLPTARSYAGVYQGRVIARLCHTAGRSEEKLRAGAEKLGGQPAEGGDLSYDFRPFPRLRLRLVWHAPDDEFPASATLLLPPNIEDYFCSEDIVVLSETLVARLSGRGF